MFCQVDKPLGLFLIQTVELRYIITQLHQDVYRWLEYIYWNKWILKCNKM